MGKKGFKILFFVLVAAALVGFALWWFKGRGVASAGAAGGGGTGTSNGTATGRVGGKSTDEKITDKINGTATGRTGGKAT